LLPRKHPQKLGLPGNRQSSSGSSLFSPPLVVYQHFPEVFFSPWATGFHQDTRVFLTQGFQSALLPLPLPPRHASLALPLAARSHRCPQHLRAVALFPQPFHRNSSSPCAAGLGCTAPSSPLPAVLWFLQLLLSEETPSALHPLAPLPPSAPSASWAAGISPHIFQLLPHLCPRVFNHLRPSPKPSWALCLPESSRAFQALRGGWEPAPAHRLIAGLSLLC